MPLRMQNSSVLEETKDSAMAGIGLLARLAYAYIDFIEDWQAIRVKSTAR